MAKSWKSFVPQSENQHSEEELLNAENDLQVSLEDFAKHNDALHKVLKEREDLEAKMQQMLNPHAADKTKEDPRFGSIITNIDEKRKADEKRFQQKRSLEIKIAEKNKEIQAWEQKKKALKTKIDKAKTLFERQKKRIEDFQKKAKKLNDDFDYDKQRERITNKVDDFPFKEQLNKPKEQSEAFKERIKNQPLIKKIKDQWEQSRELEREALTIKHQFEQKLNKIQTLKDEAKQLAKIDKIKEAITERKIEALVNQEKEKKEDEKKEIEKKKSLLERLKANREDRKVKEKEKESKEKKSLLEKREERKRQRMEEKNENQPDEKKSFLEKLEERQQKRKEKQNAENKETSKREQRREERKNRKKDKFNY